MIFVNFFSARPFRNTEQIVYVFFHSRILLDIFIYIIRTNFQDLTEITIQIMIEKDVIKVLAVQVVPPEVVLLRQAGRQVVHQGV